MHPYPEELLEGVMSTLGKAFEFADKHLPGGLESFYDLFVNSAAARTLDGPDAQPKLGSSGIELVLSVCETSTPGGLDTMLMNERRRPKELHERAKWCGKMLAYHQWDTASSLRTIAMYLSLADLYELYETERIASARVVSLKITETYAVRNTPTRLRYYRAEAGLTQANLAKISGVSLRSIQQYEQRKKNINHAQARYVLGLAQALSCQMEDLLEP